MSITATLFMVFGAVLVWELALTGLVYFYRKRIIRVLKSFTVDQTAKNNKARLDTLDDRVMENTSKRELQETLLETAFTVLKDFQGELDKQSKLIRALQRNKATRKWVTTNFKKK